MSTIKLQYISNLTGTQTVAVQDVIDSIGGFAAFLNTVGQANGLATLDANGDLEQTIPNMVFGIETSVDGQVPLFDGVDGKQLKGSPLRVDADGNIWGGGLKFESFSGTALTLDSSYNGKFIWVTGTDPVDITMPDFATDAIKGGFNCIILQGSDGIVTASQEVGASDTLLTPDDPISTSGVATAISISKPADTVWWASAGGSGSGAVVSGANIKTISATSYTILEDDNDKVLWFTANTAITVTMPGPTALPLDKNIEGVLIPAGDGQITVQGDAESDVVGSGGLLSSAQKYAPMSYFRQSETIYWVGGERA